LKRLVVAFALFASLAVASSASAATIPGQYIVVLKDGVSEPTVAADHAKNGAQVFQHYRHALNGYAAKLSNSQLATVRADKRVLFVAPDEEVEASACFNGSVFDIQSQVLPCGVDRIDGDLSSTRSGDGSGSVNVNVAVIDTGVDLQHRDLNVVGGKNCQNGNSYDDQNGHGTHVAGTIGARDDAFGVVGDAPGARLWAVRVLDKHGSGAESRVICGIDFVTGSRADADPSNDIAVVNMSLGTKGSDDGNCGRTKPDALHRAICSSVQAGVTYVVSAGNDSVDLAKQVPAGYDEVLTTTAVTDVDGKPGGEFGSVPPGGNGCSSTLANEAPVVDDTAIFFSDFASLAADQAHTVAAPGVCQLSTWGLPETFDTGSCSASCFLYESGTSMASPHVAGTVALCIYSGACAGLTPAQIRTKIVADARAYNLANTGYGFQGDPLRPIAGKYYGWLIRAGIY
jgi:subtilisin